MQVQEDGEVQPTLSGPNMADITSPSLVWGISAEVAIQQVWRDIELVVTACGDLVFASSDDLYAVLTHQLVNTAPLMHANMHRRAVDAP